MESNAEHGVAGAEKYGVEGARSAEVGMGLCDSVLRFLAFAATFVATLVMGLAKETETVYIQVASTLPPLPVPATAKSKYSSAFVYFIIANAIVVGYTVISLIISIVSKSNARKKVMLLIYILDLIMMALLFSANGAAAAFGLLGEHGNSHLGWNKVCNVFSKFCLHAKVAIVISLLASLVYMILITRNIILLHKTRS